MEIVHVIKIRFQLPCETMVPLIRIMSYDAFPENKQNDDEKICSHYLIKT